MDDRRPAEDRSTGTVELTDPAWEALSAWSKKRGLRSGDWLFPSRSHAGDHITTRQYSRLVDDWVTLASHDRTAYGTHSLRLPHIGLSARKASTALTRAGVQLGLRGLRLRRRFPSVERRARLAHGLGGLRGRQAIRHDAAPSCDGVAPSLRFDIRGLRSEKTRRRPSRSCKEASMIYRADSCDRGAIV